MLKHMELLGKITHYWNHLEHLMGVLSWAYVGDETAAYIYTSRLRSGEKVSALLELSSLREKRPRVRAAIEFITQVFHILRENRNIIVHSHHGMHAKEFSGYSDYGRAVIFTRRSKGRPTELVEVPLTLKDLRDLFDAIMKARDYAQELSDYLMPGSVQPRSRRSTLPRKFRVPRRMPQPIHIHQHTDWSPPQSFEA